MSRESTLCYIEKGGQYLMLHRVKKENDINHDKWIGIGGGIESGETPIECVIREAREETGFTLLEPEYRGIVYFSDAGGYCESMHLFTCRKFSGEMTECDEGDLEWVDISKVRDLPLWEGDRIFLELLPHERRFFRVYLHYDGDKLKSSRVQIEDRG